jgi:6-phosphogluconolactonase (cycloisomerase 2 family)
MSQPPPTAYTIGGSVTGLYGNGLTLEMNNGSDVPIAANGTFTFPGSLASGASYSVTVAQQPGVPRETCTIAAGGSGTVSKGNIDTVSVNCTTAAFVYVLDPANEIGAYGIAPSTGVPTPVGTFATTTNAYGMVAAPNGGFLYVASRQPDQIATFAIDPSQGGLTAVNSPVATGSAPCCMVASPNGSFIFLVDVGNQSLQTFAVAPTTGVLTLASTLQLQNRGCTPSGVCPGGAELAVTPDSKYVYVLGYDVLNDTTYLTPYAVDPTTGALTAGTAISLNTSQASMAIDPLGRFLYLADSAASGSLPPASATVTTYTIDSTSGALASTSYTTTVASNAAFMEPDSTGNYLYLVSNADYNTADNDVIALAVDQTTGALSQIGAAVPISAEPGAAACDPAGAFLYIANESASNAGSSSNWSDLSSLTISTSGSNAGAVSLAGQGTQFPNQTSIGNTYVAIAE